MIHSTSGSIGGMTAMFSISLVDLRSMMAESYRSKDVTIRLHNKTNESKTVLVFGREHSVPLSPAIVDDAWRTITVGAQGQATFDYPEESSVGAFYTKEDGTIVNMGPYPAPPGSAWTVILQSSFDDGTMVKEGI